MNRNDFLELGSAVADAALSRGFEEGLSGTKDLRLLILCQPLWIANLHRDLFSDRHRELLI